MKPERIRAGRAVYPQQGWFTRLFAFCSSLIFLPVRRRASRSTLTRTIVLLALLSLPVEVSLLDGSFAPQAQTPPVRIALAVGASSAGLPVTVGVPLGEAAAVTDAAQLGLINSSGAPVPSQIRASGALARAQSAMLTKTLKWVLVDFKPAAAGTYYLTRAPQTVPASTALSRTETTASIRVKSAQLELELPKVGTDLVKSFKLGGAEMLRTPVTVQADVPRAALVTKLESQLALSPSPMRRYCAWATACALKSSPR
jgi:hypothetical protein